MTHHPSHSDTRCSDVLRRISAYLDRDLDAEACRTIEEHCAGCPPCAKLVEGLRSTIGLCRATGERPLPPAVRARAKASIDRLLAGLPPHSS
jgi:anti-sigma factor (TIGR02949 family)